MTSRSLTGFGPLLRFSLRRDRIKLPAWVLGSALFALYCAQALHYAVPNENDLASLTGLLTGPAGIVLSGPGYGFEHPTTENVFAGAYGMYVSVFAACGSILLAVRHTRQEEEAERLELIRALPVSRSTPLAVAAMMLAIYSVLVALVCWAVLAPTYEPASSLLFACGVGMVCLVFGAAALVAAQLVEHARTATGYGFLALGTAFLVRGIGDVLGNSGESSERGSLVSWFSPLAWAQQTRVYVDDRWWPLGLGVALAVLLGALAVVLQRRRDLGAGLLPGRPGRARGGSALSGPLSLAFRLQRGGLIGWSITAAVTGLAFGALADQIASSLSNLQDPAILAALGGDASRVTDGYYAICLLFGVVLASGFSILAAQRLGADERTGRAELMLALPVSRARWVSSVAIVAGVGAALVLAVGGAATGLAAAAVLGQPQLISELLVASLAYLPSVLVVAATAILGYAVHPSLPGYAWVVVGYGFFVSSLGKSLGLPEWLSKFSVVEAVGSPPIGAPDAAWVWILTALALGIFGLALARIRTREIMS